MSPEQSWLFLGLLLTNAIGWTGYIVWRMKYHDAEVTRMYLSKLKSKEEVLRQSMLRD